MKNCRAKANADPEKKKRMQLVLLSILLIFTPTIVWAGWVGAHLESGLTSNTVSDSDFSAAIGSSNQVDSALHSLAVGLSNSVVGVESGSTGYSNEVDGNQSISFGYGNQTSADHAATIGRYLINESEGSVIVGTYNAEEETSYASFAVGNGTSSSATSNALIVRKDGSTVIKRLPPKGKISMGAFTQP